MANIKVIKQVVSWLKDGLDTGQPGTEEFGSEKKALTLATSDSRRNYELRYIPRAYSHRMLYNAPAELLLGVSVLTVFFVMIALGMV
ncbi:hypothetical protein AB9P05_22525 [Roseivirga sp. BDSF3-8]|uniref:hypothetical protein n=1 Tax=Roseivirga sp. BDSF3-8 TaxID=3241598 RepID=UPI003531EF56